jgi:hypothetical protein
MRFTVRQKIFPLFVLFFALTITSAAFADDLPPIFAAIHPGVNAADLNSTFGDVPIGKSLTLNLSIEFDQLIQTDGFSGSPYMKLISSSCEGSVTTCVVVLSFTPEFISTDYGFINFSSTRCGFGLGNFYRGSAVAKSGAFTHSDSRTKSGSPSAHTKNTAIRRSGDGNHNRHDSGDNAVGLHGVMLWNPREYSIC